MTTNITLDEDQRAVLYPSKIKSGKAFYARFRIENTELAGNQYYLRESMKTGNQLLATTRATQRYAELTILQNNDMVIKSHSVEDGIRGFMVKYETRLGVNLTSMILVMRQSITKFTFFFINIRNGIKLMVSGNECRTKEQTMSPWKVIITSAFFTLCASFNQQAATAGEKGTMDFVQSILIANQMAIEQGDHKMIAIVGNGTITFSNSDGGPFMEGSSATLSVIAYIKQTENGMNLESPMSVSDPSGDKLFMVMRRSTGTFDSGGGGQGRAELGGGTGKFAGLTGSCPYEVNFLDGGNVVVRATGCSWEKP